MNEQLTLFEVKIKNKKRINNKQNIHFKHNKIFDEINKMNTIKHIYRYKTLYSIYNKLFILTFEKKLDCLNYYIEDDGYFLAEIKDTYNKSLKERILLHIDLLRKVKNNDLSLIYDIDKKIDSDCVTLFG